MNIVKPNHRLMYPIKNPLKHIEEIGRRCYKSEDAITETSAEPFVHRLFERGHHAMIEHFRFIVEINQYDYYPIARCVEYNKYITLTAEGRYIMSASARGINDMYEALCNSEKIDDMVTASVLVGIAQSIISHYGCATMFHKGIIEDSVSKDAYDDVRIIEDFGELSDHEYQMHAWYSVVFTCDRGVTHEMVRHRDASFAQESTRYCNYSGGKYGSSITVIDPLFFDKNEKLRYVDGCDRAINKYIVWKDCMDYIENAYMLLTKLGATPQEARTVLPTSTKAEIVITAQVHEWNHIFDLRVLGKTGAPHPQIKEVMEPAFHEMMEKNLL